MVQVSCFQVSVMLISGVIKAQSKAQKMGEILPNLPSAWRGQTFCFFFFLYLQNTIKFVSKNTENVLLCTFIS